MNRIIQALREGMKQKLVVGTHPWIEVPAQSGLYVPVSIETNKLLLKSVEVSCNKQIPFQVQFFENAAMTNSRYHSGLVILENYDVLDLPYIDQDKTQTMHFFLENKSDYPASFQIEVRGMLMK